MSNLLLFLSVLSVVFANKDTYRRNVLFTLKPGKATCFVKIVDRFGIIKTEYQIIEKGVGVSNQTVSFEALGPRAGPVRRGGAGAAPRWPAAAAAFMMQAPELGQYRFCFDNTFDRQTKKTILFKLSVQTRNKILKNNRGRKQRKLMHPGTKTMILDPILPVLVQGVADSEVTLSELLNHKTDSIFTWEEKKHQNMIRLPDFIKLLNDGNKDLQEYIRQNQKNSKKVVASENSLMEDLEVDSYPDLDDYPDDSEDVNDPGDRNMISATETITGSRSWLPYQWDMIDYA